MMILNCGEISLNKPLTEDAVNIIAKHIAVDCMDGEDCIVFEEYYGQELHDDLQKMLDELSSIGYTGNGSICYFGDYDGRYDINDNVVTELDETDIVISEVDTEKLIAEISKRGYIISKKINFRGGQTPQTVTQYAGCIKNKHTKKYEILSIVPFSQLLAKNRAVEKAILHNNYEDKYDINDIVIKERTATTKFSKWLRSPQDKGE